MRFGNFRRIGLAFDIIYRIMLLACAILFATLSRAELIERFRAPRIVQVDGLVQVRAECNAAMRREYQLPIAGFAADVCRRLYRAENLREKHFEQPGVVIVIGDVVTNLTNVVSRTEKREDGAKYVKILLPAPGYADRDALSAAVARGYFLAVHDLALDDEAARKRLRETVPELKLEDDYRALEEWYAGKRGKDDDDEKYLKLQRSILQPGVATKHDVEIFASRQFLYPAYFDSPFCGKYECLSYRDAIESAAEDPAIRIAAHLKVQEAVLFSGGRGERMSAAGLAYAAFLNDLAGGVKSAAELNVELDVCETLLKGVLNENEKNDN